MLTVSVAPADAVEITPTERLCLTSPPGSASFARSHIAIGPIGTLRWLNPIATPTPSRIVAFNADLSLALWNAETGELMAELAGREGNPALWELSPDGTRAVIARYDAPAQLWDLVLGRKLADLPVVRRADYRATGSVVFSNDGTRLIANDTIGRALLLDARTGDSVAELQPEPGHASFAFVEGYIARNGDGVLQTWDQSGRPITSLNGADLIRFGDPARILSIRDGGWALLESPTSRTLAQRDAETAQTIRIIDPLRSGRGRSSRFFVTRSADEDGSRVPLAHTLWDSATGLATLQFTAAPQDIVMSPNGVALLTRDSGGEAFLWNAHTGRRVARLGHFVRPSDMEEVFSGEDEEPYSYWRLRTGENLPFEFRFSQAGDLLATRDRSGDGAVWDTQSGDRLHRLGRIPRDAAVMFSPASRWMIVAPSDDEAGLWSIRGRQIGNLQRLGMYAPSPTFSPDEESVVIVGEDGHARLWRTRDASVVAELGGGREFFFSPDSTRLIVDSDLWDGARGVRLGELGHGVVSFATLEGRNVITVRESFPYVWLSRDPTTGEERRTPIEPSLRIYDSNGSPLGACVGNIKWYVLDATEGRRIVTVTAEGDSILWRPL